MKYNGKNIIAFLSAINENFEKVIEKYTIGLTITDTTEKKGLEGKYNFTMLFNDKDGRYLKTMRLDAHKLQIDPYSSPIFKTEGNPVVNLNDEEYDTIRALIQEIAIKATDYKNKKDQEFFDEIMNM